MVKVDGHIRSGFLWIGEPEYSGAKGRCHLRLDSAVQSDAIVARISGFFLVVKFGRLWIRAGSGQEKEIAEIRDASPAQVCQTETLNGRFRVLVSRGAVIILVVAVRADLYPAVRQLRSGIHVPEPVRAHEHVHVVDKFLLCLAGND